MKDLEKYINRTIRKTKKEKLPITPIMPDSAAGISSFNDYVGDNGGQIMGEEFNEAYYQDLESDIIQKTVDYMRQVGFEDDAEAYTDFEFEETASGIRIDVRAELDYDSLIDLCDILNLVVYKYDENAYFDVVTGGIIQAYIRENLDINEQLKRLDKKGFDTLHENFDLHQLYESSKGRLDNRDKSKLQKFLRTTDDPAEVNTYMRGLLSEDSSMWIDPEPASIEYEKRLNNLGSLLDRVAHEVEFLQETARKDDNEDIEGECEMLLIELDDLKRYRLANLEEIIEQF